MSTLRKEVAESLDMDILMEEVDRGVNKLRDGTSAGRDGSTPKLIKWLFTLVPQLFLDFARDFLRGNSEDRADLLIKNMIFITKATK